MIKLILCIVLISLIAYVGYGIERFYRIRYLVAKEYNEILTFVKRETCFLKTTILEMIEKYNFSSKYLKQLLVSTIDNSFLEIDKKLDEKLVFEVKSFLKEFCTCDYSNVKSILLNANEKSKILLNSAENEKIQKGELGRKLTILVGIGLLIVLI